MEGGEVEYPETNIKCILLDIEGTICPISFVKDTLFPYALKALPNVLKTQWDSHEFKPFRDEFPEEFRESPEALQAHVEDLTKRDVKVAYLKGLQGYLWQYGYESGEYSTPLYPDVVPKLKFWIDEGRKIAIYSSGSVFAQKLLFGHVKSTTSAGVKRVHEDITDGSAEDEEPPSKKRAAAQSTKGVAPNANVEAEGSAKTEDAPTSESREEVPTRGNNTEDLRNLISNWFDTTNAGPKTEEGSYAIIAMIMNMLPSEILFLSDNVDELGAAVDARMDAILIERPGNAPNCRHDKANFGAVDSLERVHMVALPPRDRVERSPEPEASEDAVAVEEDDAGEEE